MSTPVYGNNSCDRQTNSRRPQPQPRSQPQRTYVDNPVRRCINRNYRPNSPDDRDAPRDYDDYYDQPRPRYRDDYDGPRDRYDQPPHPRHRNAAGYYDDRPLNPAQIEENRLREEKRQESLQRIENIQRSVAPTGYPEYSPDVGYLFHHIDRYYSISIKDNDETEVSVNSLTEKDGYLYFRNEGECELQKVTHLAPDSRGKTVKHHTRADHVRCRSAGFRYVNIYSPWKLGNPPKGYMFTVDDMGTRNFDDAYCLQKKKFFMHGGTGAACIVNTETTHSAIVVSNDTNDEGPNGLIGRTDAEVLVLCTDLIRFGHGENQVIFKLNRVSKSVARDLRNFKMDMREEITPDDRLNGLRTAFLNALPEDMKVVIKTRADMIESLTRTYNHCMAEFYKKFRNDMSGLIPDPGATREGCAINNRILGRRRFDDLSDDEKRRMYYRFTGILHGMTPGNVNGDRGAIHNQKELIKVLPESKPLTLKIK